MSDSVDTAEFVELCLVLSALSRPESAFTNPEIRLVVSIPDPTPLKLLVESAMVLTQNERPVSRFPQHYFGKICAFCGTKAGQAADPTVSGPNLPLS
ncbi:MAG: hypothetical protein ABW061_25290 [Polyangiaceae bacterium]